MAKKQGITWTNEKRKLSDLIPWERNPRTINNAQAERLVDSVETFGQVETLAIDCRNGVLNGHQRLNVLAGQYGMDYEVDVRVANRVLTERERQQLTVYLHRGTTGAWDFEELANSFEFDDLVTWGFSEEELLGLDFGEEPTSAGADTEPQIDKAEELRVKWNVSSGQLWALGEHKIICGDCTDAAVVASVMGGEKIRCVWTDPPYGVSYADKNEFLNALNRGNSNQTAIEHDHMSESDTERLATDALRLAVAHAQKGASVYVACPPGTLLPHFIAAVAASGFTYKHSLVWVKNQFVLGRCDYHYRHELILYGWIENGAHYFVDDHTKHSVFEIDKPRNSDEHPTMKPVELVTGMLENSTRSNDIVYEPFSGSGTTLIACQNLGRKCRAVEISPGYVAVAIERFYQHTSIEPVLIA